MAMTTGMVQAKTTPKELGTDPSGDTAPGWDLTSLSVARAGSDLDITIGMTAIPQQMSFPDAGIQWAFASGGRVFAVEAHIGANEYGFSLYQITPDGGFALLKEIDGTVDAGAGEIHMFVPLRDISAKRGTAIVGRQISDGVGDVEVHQHLEVTSEVMDHLETTKAFKIR
jgi:hypothetical protein